MVQFNIIDTLFKQYKQRFPEATMDNFLTYIQRNYPRQYKWAQQFVNNARDYTTGTLDDLKELKQQTQTNIQQPKQSTPKAQVKPNAMEQRMTKEGLTKAATKGASIGSKAKNIVQGGKTLIKGGAKAGGKLLGPLVSSALEAPGIINRWNDPDADLISKGYDVATGLSAVLFPVNPIGSVAGMVAFPNASEKRIEDNRAKREAAIPYEQYLNTPQSSVKQLTPEEQERYNQYVINQADNTQTQLNNQIQQTKNAIDWYNAFDNRIANEYNKVNQDIANYNMSLPAAPRTGLNYNLGTSNPQSNLTPINKPPTSANNNQPIITKQGNNQMVNQQPNNTQPTNNDMANLMNNIQLLNSYIGGVQRGNVLPNLGVSNEELQAYSNALRQYGENVSRARADVEAYRDALNRSNKMQAVAGVLNGLGQATSGFFPGQSMASVVPGLGYINPGRTEGVNLNNLGQPLVNAADRQLQNVQTNLALNNQLRQQEENRAAQFADLLTAARVSNATGLPLNIARQMTSEDYLNYINPFQEAHNRAQELAIEGAQDLITNRQQQLADYARALDVQALQNRGQLSNQQLQQLGQYQRELLSQNAANQRAQLDALVQTRVAELNNNTKLQLMQMTGMNAQQLERLRQSDPNAYLRAVGNVLMATTYSTTPQARQIENILYNEILNDIQPGQTTGTRQPASQSYWAQFNQ